MSARECCVYVYIHAARRRIDMDQKPFPKSGMTVEAYDLADE